MRTPPLKFRTKVGNKSGGFDPCLFDLFDLCLFFRQQVRTVFNKLFQNPFIKTNQQLKQIRKQYSVC